VGTVLLAIMALCSAGFVWRMLEHTHLVKIDTLQNIYNAKGEVVGKKGRTTTNQQHSHEVEILPDGSGKALSSNEQEHDISSHVTGGETTYHISGPRGLLRARVPEYGKVRFTDRKGVE